MSTQITEVENFDQYQQFVLDKLSRPSTNFNDYLERLIELSNEGCNIQMLDTASQGLLAETGEIGEIVKKIKYQGKPWNNETQVHLVKEMSDTLFYLALGCEAMGVSLDDIMHVNVDKLNKRYQEGFTVQESENRKDGDL